MITIPPDLKTRFQAFLITKALPKNHHFHYNKWLRYYWDFCHKYGYPAANRESMPHFVNKLREKKQKKFQIEQAENAISIFYEITRQDHKISKPTPCTRQSKPFMDNGFKGTPAAQGPTACQHYDNKYKKVSEKTAHYKPFSNQGAAQKQQVRANHVHQQIAGQKVLETETTSRPESPETGTSWKPAFDGMRDEIKLRHYSPKTLKSYSSYLAKFQAFTKSKPVASLTDADIKAFLTFLAVKKKVAASTQNVAFNALLFFFRHVLKKEPGDLKNIPRAKRKPYIPVVLSREEIDRIFLHLSHPYDLIAKLLYGCGLRLFECLNLRVNNFNIDAGVLTVHDGKGKKDRTVPLPETVIPQIQTQLGRVISLHELDLKAGYAGAFMFGRIEKKYKNAAKELIWQWFFPAFSLTRVPETGEKRRYHIHERHVQREIREAVRMAKLLKRVTAHTFRHSFATHLLEANYDIRTIQELLGHSDVRTTMIYTHTIKSRTLKEAKSPLDFYPNVA